MEANYDVIVVGGSFAGLSAAMQLVRARRSVLVVDSGLTRNRFAAHAHGFFGLDGKAPRDIVRDAAAQVAAYPTARLIEGEVVAAQRSGAGFVVTLASGATATATRLILAAGVRDELPEIAGLRERWGATVLHCPYCHGYEVRDGRLGVLATHALSVHAALLLPDWGPTIYLVQPGFEPDAAQREELARRRVRIEHSPVVELLGPAPALEAVRLADGRTIEMDAIFVAPRTVLTNSLAASLGCEIEAGPLGDFIRVDEVKQTTVEGVFAAGDAATAFANATLASAAGVMAGVAAHRSLVMAHAVA
ncbi:NAD(P)/FAD-dependent oxidoreductase [Trinickia caryophylli]|uniref:Thioredoxin reductase n=1 Tax=Trinickia caryophylli TaxID=28094 RepID=A0A1X7EUX6_TRICW|nr:NAD(P)/FAD-dependent oxidoreductase [Trinickia caryophylli]PMS12194.1 NAD(P)/FAD-dependent oxidoreductase [Trinickia caryophylli]TRX18497.1 NAD(P)/FAD-dependent oxidoreductase [Trinickia caryophylli]WQE10714.1 NAD(P)/FAD-dependent oxidoreductase [Trinickia caryophylli]SMF40715.1 Thioredoxin reductase [Trinickia caryophylli]GLU33086.1 hypothetical protein Busp01_29280 [Trinickia caryophylli]